MLTYSLTIAAAAEILKANVSAEDDALAFLAFAVASILTILAPIVVAFTSPDRADERLATWRRWLLGNSRTIGLIALIVMRDSDREGRPRSHRLNRTRRPMGKMPRRLVQARMLRRCSSSLLI